MNCDMVNLIRVANEGEYSRKWVWLTGEPGMRGTAVTATHPYDPFGAKTVGFNNPTNGKLRYNSR